MKVLGVTVLLLLFFPSSPADEAKVLKLRKAPSPIIVDGTIDPAWTVADSSQDFNQLQPYYGQSPSRKTVARILSTDDALYCLMVCYDEPEHIQRATGLHDDFNGDFVSIMLDTFNDRQSAYKFGVTASGTRSDSRLLDDARNRDQTWDGVWFSASEIYDWGYVVEIEIPYRSLRYDERLDSWGLDFDRWRPVNSEDLYWNRYQRDEGQRVSKFGQLVFDGVRPTAKGNNLELYPVGVVRADYISEGKYEVDPLLGLDVFYNPSPQLTLQLTGNPDFAQIEADPFSFNISRYESYFDERRPFFTQGAEVFMASGRQRSSGFYRPMELFYSRRIGKILPDGEVVPLSLGSKVFGRSEEWEYGAFVALTDETPYEEDDVQQVEPQAWFVSGRVKKQIMGNSSIGILAVNKHTSQYDEGVVDIDGAFRESNWQLAYQFARSFGTHSGGYAASAGFLGGTDSWFTGIRGRAVGENFEVDQVGFVPWQGTAEFVGLTGPRWFFDTGGIREILIYAGPSLHYEKVDQFMDRSGVLGFNMQLRANWGWELNLSAGRSKDNDVEYTSYEASLSSWFYTSPKWNGNLWMGYSRTYNFNREWVAFYSWAGGQIDWTAANELRLGTSLNAFVEGNPQGRVEDVTLNARPYVSVTPFNNLNLRLYVDNVYAQSSDKLEQMIIGFLFSYNFLPKSWIYFAVNEVQDRSEEYDGSGNLLPAKLHTIARVAVAKVRYLFYF